LQGRGKTESALLFTLTNFLILPKECPHSSEREEPFYSLGVEIKNKEDLNGSLSLFVEGEMLVGDNKYFCDTCNRSVETLKRCCVKYLPNILVVHLKRFEFDFDNMVHRKLNDRCKFPR
jgi:ubiquitin carboxyl-terminal hydrolase 34